jgi:hypothetical protein
VTDAAPDACFKLTERQRVEWILATRAMRDALALGPSYERALAIQNAERLVLRARRLMVEASRRRAHVLDD